MGNSFFIDTLLWTLCKHMLDNNRPQVKKLSKNRRYYSDAEMIIYKEDDYYKQTPFLTILNNMACEKVIESNFEKGGQVI